MQFKLSHHQFNQKGQQNRLIILQMKESVKDSAIFNESSIIDGHNSLKMENAENKTFFQQDKQECKESIKRKFNQLVDRAANFFQCTRLFSTERLEEIRRKADQEIQQRSYNHTTKSMHSDQFSNNPKLLTASDHKSQLKSVESDLAQDKELPIKNYEMKNVLKFQKKYAETYDESYSERQIKFKYTFEQVCVRREIQYQKKVKTFWGELKRLLFCQGGNYVDDIQQSQRTSAQIKQKSFTMSRTRQPHLIQNYKESQNNIFLQENYEQIQAPPQEIKFQKRQKKNIQKVKYVSENGQKLEKQNRADQNDELTRKNPPAHRKQIEQKKQQEFKHFEHVPYDLNVVKKSQNDTKQDMNVDDIQEFPQHTQSHRQTTNNSQSHGDINRNYDGGLHFQENNRKDNSNNQFSNNDPNNYNNAYNQDSIEYNNNNSNNHPQSNRNDDYNNSNNFSNRYKNTTNYNTYNNGNNMENNNRFGQDENEEQEKNPNDNMYQNSDNNYTNLRDTNTNRNKKNAQNSSNNQYNSNFDDQTNKSNSANNNNKNSGSNNYGDNKNKSNKNTLNSSNNQYNSHMNDQTNNKSANIKNSEQYNSNFDNYGNDANRNNGINGINGNYGKSENYGNNNNSYNSYNNGNNTDNYLHVNTIKNNRKQSMPEDILLSNDSQGNPHINNQSDTNHENNYQNNDRENHRNRSNQSKKKKVKEFNFNTQSNDNQESKDDTIEIEEDLEEIKRVSSLQNKNSRTVNVGLERHVPADHQWGEQDLEELRYDNDNSNMQNSGINNQSAHTVSAKKNKKARKVISIKQEDNMQPDCLDIDTPVMSNSNKKMGFDSYNNESQVPEGMFSSQYDKHSQLAKRKKNKKRANLVVVGQNIDEQINVDDL